MREDAKEDKMTRGWREIQIEHTTYDSARQSSNSSRPYSSPSSQGRSFVSARSFASASSSRPTTIEPRGSLASTSATGNRVSSGSIASTTSATTTSTAKDSHLENRPSTRPITLWPSVPKGNGYGDEKTWSSSSDDGRRGKSRSKQNRARPASSCGLLRRLSCGVGPRNRDNTQRYSSPSPSSQRRSAPDVPIHQRQRKPSVQPRTRSTRRADDEESRPLSSSSRRRIEFTAAASSSRYRPEPQRRGTATWEESMKRSSKSTSTSISVSNTRAAPSSVSSSRQHQKDYPAYPSPPQTPSPEPSRRYPLSSTTQQSASSSLSSYSEKHKEKPLPEIKDDNSDKENNPQFPGRNASTASKGKNLWRPGPLDPCRLCKIRNVVGVRGLCLECEHDFVRPETIVAEKSAGPEITTSSSPPTMRGRYDFDDDDDDEEVKPPVPLKDKRTLDRAARLRRGGNVNDRERGRGKYRDGESSKIANAPRGEPRPPNPSLSSPPSPSDTNTVTGKVDGRYWDKDDQAQFMAHEREKTQQIIRGWGIKEERREMERRRERERGEEDTRDGKRKRRTSFYRFWDDILRE